MRRRWTGFAAVLVLVATSAPAAAATGKLALHVVDVGQGDGMLLECPDGTIAMVVDSADQHEKRGGVKAWQAYVEARLDASATVPLVVASHMHADHIGGLAWLLRRNAVTLLVDNGTNGRGTAWKDYAAARDEDGKVVTYTPIQQGPGAVALCDGQVTATPFAPAGLDDERCGRDQNRCSVLVRIDYGTTSFLLTGDAESSEEKLLLRTADLKQLLDVDVLKVGHHGSTTSSTKNFLAAVSPRCAVVSAGDPARSTRNGGKNGYHLPRVATLDAVEAALPRQKKRVTLRAYDAKRREWVDAKRKAALRLTARDGDVVIASDGKRVACP